MKDIEETAPAMASGIVTKQIDVNGTQVTYHEAGQSNTDAPPVVLVHGSSGSTQGHFGFLFPLLAVNHRVISLDLADPARGDAPLELDMLEAQVCAVIKASSKDQPVTLLGYSLGAVITASLAAKHGDLVQNLVLLTGWIKTDMYMTLFNRTWHALRAANSPQLDDFTIFSAFGAPFMSSKTFEDLAGGAAMPLDEFVDAQMELNARIDISGLVPQITAKTLVISCTYDQMVPVHHGRALFGMIDDARYAEVASGHAVVFERPAEVVRLVDRFARDPSEYAAGATIPAIKP